MEITKQLIRFIADSPSPFHVCENAAQLLLKAGCEEVSETSPTPLAPGKSYFIRRNGSSLIAFRMPKDTLSGFMICASHSDSPSFKIKDSAELTQPAYTRINAEPYGGMIGTAWMDRPLSAAGKLLVRTESGKMKPVLVNLDKNSLLIPNIAPHMTRVKEFNPACDFVPLYGDGAAANTFRAAIAEAAGVAEEDVLSADLYLYNREMGYVWGPHDEYFSSPRLDDLQCAYASITAFLAGAPSAHTAAVCAILDNEEVGSTTKQGAAGLLLSDTLHRIVYACGGSEADYMTVIARSMMISADNAHAVHPNHPEFADPTHRPEMNRGIVIKHNANQKYTTDAVSAALFEDICRRANVPHQHYFNRSDMPGGSTLGNISNTQVSLNTVDIGLPQLAMHSPLETAGTHDTAYLAEALKVFFASALTYEADGTIGIVSA